MSYFHEYHQVALFFRDTIYVDARCVVQCRVVLVLGVRVRCWLVPSSAGLGLGVDLCQAVVSCHVSSVDPSGVHCVQSLTLSLT